MPGLRELQLQFGANLIDAGAQEILARVRPGAFAPAQRTQVYRNNVYTSLTDALRAIYPVVERLVGDGFFLYASHEFITRFPSAEGNLHAFGAEFPAHLAGFGPARGLPYLPDVARLEWHYHEVYHEAEAGGLDAGALRAFAPEQYAGLRFRLHPAHRLMHSAHPVLDIWRVNQPDFQGDQSVDLDAGGVQLLLLRSGEDVAIHPLGPGEYRMLTELARCRTLGESVEAALEADPGFDLQGFLARHIQINTVTGITADTTGVEP